MKPTRNATPSNLHGSLGLWEINAVLRIDEQGVFEPQKHGTKATGGGQKINLSRGKRISSINLNSYMHSIIGNR